MIMLAIAVLKNIKLDRFLFGLFVYLFSFAMGCNDGQRERKSTPSSTSADNKSGSAGGGEADPVPVVCHAEDCINKKKQPVQGSGLCACVLCYAVAQRNLDRVKRLLDGEGGFNANDIDKVYKTSSNKEVPTPLFKAVSDRGYQFPQEQYNMVELLIQRGANVDAKYNKEPVLFRAVVDNQVNLAMLLVRNNADINAKYMGSEQYQGEPVWVRAIQNGRLDMVKVLFDQAPLGDMLYKGQTPVVFAKGSSKEIESYLAEKAGRASRGAKSTPAGNKGGSTGSGGANPVSMVSHSKTSKPPRGGPLTTTPVGSQRVDRMAAEGERNGGTVIHVRDCIDRGKSSSVLCLCALHLAIEQQDVDMVQELIQRGIDVNQVYTTLIKVVGREFKKNSCPPLYAAVDKYLANSDASIKIVQKLIDKGADVNTKFANRSVLYLAVEKNSLPIVQLLIDKGADVNTSYANRPVLYLAVEKNSLPIIQLLIDKGADVNTKFTNRSVLYLAVEKNSLPIVQLLIDKGADVNTSYVNKPVLYLAVETESLPIIQKLIDKGADVNAYYANRSVLYLAVEKNSLPIVQELVKGKDVNVHLRCYGKSILEKAKETNPTIYNLLLNYSSPTSK